MDHAAEDVRLRGEAETSGPVGMTAAGDGASPDEAFPHELPVLPVRNMVVFPGTIVPLNIGREKAKRLIDDVLKGTKLLAVVAQRHEETEDPALDDIYRVGTAAQVLKLLRAPDGANTLLVHGLLRVGVEQFLATDPYWMALVNPHRDPSDTTMQTEALMYSARRIAEQVIELSPNVPEEARTILANIDAPGPLADFLAANLSLGIVQKQELLETFDVSDRLRKVNATLQNQLDVLELARKIQTDVRKEIDRSQRQYYLQEQLKAIQKELGDDDPRAAELAELETRINESGLPEAALKEAQREFQRLQRISPASPETGVIRDYLDWLTEMPWNAATEDDLDLNRAAEVLDADHYGLEKIKRRILEYLAVRKLNPGGRSPILCFAGPPGVGKTSLGQSIARALGRKFVRIALGGVRDEADIRGHRRTYIGSMPGRIMQEIRKVGVRNPVMMLDEMDKIGSDFRGDPAAALLEVLDPEQNHSFTDHYLGVPFDLSPVLFIGTANYMDAVEPALRDRMEVIHLAGYTVLEKLEIAKRYLVPRQVERNGLTAEHATFSDDVLREIIERHTREAGVRNLERCIGSVCRTIAARVARDEKVPAKVSAALLADALGPPRFEQEVAERVSVPGIATGLAWTPVGGAILFVEATCMPGRGGFALTGQIGDVMRESAQAALSLIRTRTREWNVPVEQLKTSDIHVHVPAGAIPKDGPSAGIAMLTALYSILTGTVVSSDVGMTGEITLRGLVLPIGGVKEKVLAAHRAGLKTVILPARNEADLDEVPESVRKELKFVLASHAEEVLLAAIPALSRTPQKAGSAGVKKKRPATKRKKKVKKSSSRAKAKRPRAPRAKRS